ncbi:MAG: hypothetical protein FWG03_01705 [Clostridiales bacterium]|nr:hypothetical protein [Clostridiales bacterium]
MPYNAGAAGKVRSAGVFLVSIYLYHWPLLGIFRQVGAYGASPEKDGGALFAYVAFAVFATVFIVEFSHLAFDKKAKRPVRLIILGFCVSLVLSALLATAEPHMAYATEDDRHQQALQSIDMMEEGNASLAGLEMDPVAMQGREEELPLMPSQVEALDIETDTQRTKEAAARASERDGPDGPVKPIAPPPGVTVTLIGDSVPLGASERIAETLGSVTIDAEVSRHMGFGAEIVEDYASRGELGEYVIIALFTNVHSFTEPATNQTLEAIPPGHRVIAVTPFGNPGLEEYARMVRDLPLFYDYVTVADWNAAIRDQNYMLSKDNIHVNGRDSCQIYANLLSLAIEQAGRKPAKR